MSKRTALIATGLAMIVGLVVLRWAQDRRGGNPQAVRPSAAVKDEHGVLPPMASETEDDPRALQATAGEDGAPARDPLPSPALFGRVLRADTRKPVAGAWVSWTSTPPGGGNPQALWIDPASIRERTLRATSAADGTFAFPEFPPPGEGSVVWASADGLESNAARWSSASPAGALELALQPRASLDVLVVDGSGRPVPEARVAHGAYTTPYDGLSDEDLRKALHVYLRESTTDSEGRLRVPMHAGYQALWAEAGGLRSTVWVDRAQGVRSLTLSLAPTLEISVNVVIASDAIDPSTLEVLFSGNDGGVLRFQARRPVDAWGQVEAVALPATFAAGYEVALRGGDVIPRVRRIEAQAAGASLHVELLAELGFELPVRVSDPDGVPIAGARATFVTELEGSSSRAFGQSDVDGLARVRGMAPGSGFLTVDADGFRPLTSEQLHFEIPPEEPVAVVLAPSGVLEGRCTSEDGPVRDFEVVVWAVDRGPLDFTSEVFAERADGSFRFEDVPTGDVMVLAFSAEHGLPRCEAVPVHVTRHAPAQVELRLPVSQLGRGRVVDITTGDAPPGAFLQLWANHGGQLQRPMGAPLSVGADGRFEIRGLGPGDVRVQVSAPGYSNVIAHARAEPGATVDFGAIGVAPLQTLEVALTAEEGHSGGPYQVSLTGQEWHPIQEVGARAVARFEGVSPGRWNVRVRGEGFDLSSFQEFLPGRPWSLTFPVSGSGALLVRHDLSAGAARPTGWSVEARAVGDLGNRTLRLAPLSEDGLARFAGLPPGRYSLFLMDERQATRGSTVVDLRDADTTVAIATGDARLSIAVVSPDGQRLSQVHVQLDGAAPDSAWFDAALTGVDGQCTFEGLPSGDYVCGLWHAEHGWRLGLPVRVGPSGAQHVELTFESSHVLRARLTESGEPRAGVQVHVRDAAGRYPLLSQVSDDDGRIAHPSLARGSYLLIVDQPGYWPTTRRVNLERVSGEASLELRSTGALSITADSGSKGATSPVQLELVDLTSGSNVSEWLAEGRVASSTASMACDAQGRLELSGLPSGTYSWRVAAGDAAGEVVVPRRGTAPLDILLP